jgi:hypothetical protein
MTKNKNKIYLVLYTGEIGFPMNPRASLGSSALKPLLTQVDFLHLPALQPGYYGDDIVVLIVLSPKTS